MRTESGTSRSRLPVTSMWTRAPWPPQYSAVVAALGVYRLQETPIGREMDPAASVARGQVQVNDELNGRMVGINREVDRAVELLVGAYLSKGFFLGKGPSRRDQQCGDCHRMPPCNPDPAWFPVSFLAPLCGRRGSAASSCPFLVSPTRSDV